MIAPDGRREPFPAAGFLLGRDGQAICFETRPPRDLSRRYIAVELRAVQQMLLQCARLKSS